MTQKSLFEKFMTLFRKQQKKHGGSRLSVTEAINAQNKYIAAYCPANAPISAPFPEIVKQLYTTKPEIFEAALYYLQKIARNEPEQAKEIIQEMNKCLSDKNKISLPNKKLIAQTIEILKNLAESNNLFIDK